MLIGTSPPHRRARSAAFSYHFYPDERWMDLTITLPCSIVLREVHVQPHVTSLASECAARLCTRYNRGHHTDDCILLIRSLVAEYIPVLFPDWLMCSYKLSIQIMRSMKTAMYSYRSLEVEFYLRACCQCARLSHD